MIPLGCLSRLTRKVSPARCLREGCLRMRHGRRSVFRFSKSGSTRGVLRKQGRHAGDFCVEKYSGQPPRLLVRDHFAEVGDVLLDSGDLLRPGSQALVWYSGSVLSFGFGKRFECVLQLLVKRGAIHMRRLSLERARTAAWREW